MRYIPPGLKIVFKLVISMLFFAVLLSFVKGNELLEVFSRIDWLYFCLSFALAPVMLVVSCTKWKIILDKGGVRVPMARLLRIYCIGYFFSNILPSTVGGDVIRSFYAGRETKNQAYAAVSVFLERFTGILLLFVLVMVMPLLRPDIYQKASVYLPALGGFTALTFVLVIFMMQARGSESIFSRTVRICNVLFSRLVNYPVFNRLTRLVPLLERVSEKILKKEAKVRQSLKTATSAMHHDKGFLFQVIALTAVFYFLTMVNVYVSFKAFHVDVSFVAVCVLVPTALFAAHLPVTVLGNLGYFESIFVFYFLLVGVPGAESLAMGLLLRLKVFTLGVTGFFLYVSFRSSTGTEGKELERFLEDNEVKAGPNLQ